MTIIFTMINYRKEEKKRTSEMIICFCMPKGTASVTPTDFRTRFASSSASSLSCDEATVVIDSITGERDAPEDEDGDVMLNRRGFVYS